VPKFLLYEEADEENEEQSPQKENSNKHTAQELDDAKEQLERAQVEFETKFGELTCELDDVKRQLVASTEQIAELESALKSEQYSRERLEELVAKLQECAKSNASERKKLKKRVHMKTLQHNLIKEEVREQEERNQLLMAKMNRCERRAKARAEPMEKAKSLDDANESAAAESIVSQRRDSWELLMVNNEMPNLRTNRFFHFQTNQTMPTRRLSRSEEQNVNGDESEQQQHKAAVDHQIQSGLTKKRVAFFESAKTSLM